ncbi:hypothetical protein [Nesterenkonia marinintestina]|uniref:hypothetical protein n=1 Tax=Nesterenkonia marinintestina TaxID=2979865 RepID=UPI0021C1E357|nr:hypothetical protein [Nesterenkonia sp. GX14115]
MIWLVLGAMTLIIFMGGLALHPLRMILNLTQITAFGVFVFALWVSHGRDKGALGDGEWLDVILWSGAIWVGLLVLRALPMFFNGAGDPVDLDYVSQQEPGPDGFEDAYNAGYLDAQAQYYYERGLADGQADRAEG